ncbi:MAG: ANL family adenylate-forming protein [Microbacterium sp.]
MTDARVLFVDGEAYPLDVDRAGDDAVAVPRDAGRSMARRIAVFIEQAAAAVLASRPFAVNVELSAGTRSELLERDIAVVFPTSGSSGSPKWVLQSQEAMRYQATETARRMQISSQRWAFSLPATHAYGFSGVNMWARSGGELHWYQPGHLRVLLAGISERRFDSLDTGASTWRHIWRHARDDRALLDGVRALHVRGVGGQMLAASLATRFDEIGAPLHDGYGLSEAGPNVAINTGLGYRAGTVGRPLDGTAVLVDDEGQLRIKSPSVSSLLLVDGEVVTNAAVDSGGWLRTGDLGRTRDGYVVIEGRRSTAVHQHGEKIAVESLEHQLEDGLAGGAAVYLARVGSDDTGDRIVAAVFGSSMRADEFLDIVRQNRAHLPRPFFVQGVRWFETGETPLTPTGKVDRKGLSRLIERSES